MTIFKGLVGELRAVNGKVAKVVELESLLTIQKNTTDVLKNENDRLNKRINSLEMIVDNNEQHNRNINLVLHGVPEKMEKIPPIYLLILRVRVYKLAMMTARSHRLGPPRGNGHRPRPIIARDETKKNSVYRSKNSLKGVKLLLTENLTKWRQSLFKTDMSALGTRRVWTNHGRIFTKFRLSKFSVKMIFS